jgi:hypothetical protein
MSEKIILKIDKQHFSVELYENMLKIDLKDSLKNGIEEALENKQILRETIGRVLGMFVPLHIRLSDIKSANVDKSGNIKINMLHHRDITLPLGKKDAEELLKKLNKLIPEAKKEELKRLMIEEKEQRIAEEELEVGRAGSSFPTLQSPSSEVPEIEDELREEEEKKSH